MKKSTALSIVFHILLIAQISLGSSKSLKKEEPVVIDIVSIPKELKISPPVVENIDARLLEENKNDKKVKQDLIKKSKLEKINKIKSNKLKKLQAIQEEKIKKEILKKERIAQIAKIKEENLKAIKEKK